MKMSLRFTAVHSWFSLHRPFALRSTTRKPIWFLTRQECPGYRPSVGQSVGFVAEFQQPVVDF